MLLSLRSCVDAHQELHLGGVRQLLEKASAVSPKLIEETVRLACRRVSASAYSAKSAHISRLLQAAAWTDLALLLVELELPQWRVRRLIRDDGQWQCVLTKHWQLPDWLDETMVEAFHQELPIAILAALVEAKEDAAP